MPVRAETGVNHPLLKAVQRADAATDIRLGRAKLAGALRRVDAAGGSHASITRAWEVIPRVIRQSDQRSNAARSAPSSRPSVVASTRPCGGPTQAR